MRETVTLDALYELAQTTTYDDLPTFLTEHREYASRIGLNLPRQTDEEKERYQYIFDKVKELENPGIPRGMGMN